jgi:hypothetical protein
VGNLWPNVSRKPSDVQTAAVRCDMVLHRAFRARHPLKNGFGGEVRHGVTSSVSRETSVTNVFAGSKNQNKLIQRVQKRAM